MYHNIMNLYPSFYFLALEKPLVLSNEFNLSLRPPRQSELPLWTRNASNIFGALSDKEKRRILYTLHPLGLPEAKGSLDEIFTQILAPLWLGLDFAEGFFLSPEEYGAICGMPLGGGYLRSPLGFTANGGTRLYLRALKFCLAPIGTQPHPDLSALQAFALGLDGILAQEKQRGFIKRLGRTLAAPAPTREAEFLKLALAAEILTVNEGGAHGRQFAYKLALIRHIMLRKKNEKALVPPEKAEEIFSACYRLRSALVHGQTASVPKSLGEKSHMLFSAVRLALRLMVEDPLLFFYIRGL